MEKRRLSFAGIGLGKQGDSRIVEHEMDMVRRTEGPVAGVSAVTRIVKWLMPSGRLVAPPMRSVARELEEAFPARDRDN
jgi:hypothetical protein